MLAALVAFLGRLGSLGEPQGGAMAGQGPLGVGVLHSTGCCQRKGEGEGGGPEKTTETLPGSTWHSSTPRQSPPPHSAAGRRMSMGTAQFRRQV